MRDIDDALAGISLIRSHLARATEFRAVGAATLAVTGGIAVIAGWLQQHAIVAPLDQMSRYLTLWVAAAVLSVALVGAEMVWRAKSVHGGLAEAMIMQAVGQFLPCGVIGALLTLVLVRFAPQSLWLCPGLWQILFSFGFFASKPFLPPACFAVGIWYLTCGLGCIAFAQGELALSPWAMGLPFAGGQMLLAAVIAVRRHDPA